MSGAFRPPFAPLELLPCCATWTPGSRCFRPLCPRLSDVANASSRVARLKLKRLGAPIDGVDVARLWDRCGGVCDVICSACKPGTTLLLRNRIGRLRALVFIIDAGPLCDSLRPLVHWHHAFLARVVGRLPPPLPVPRPPSPLPRPVVLYEHVDRPLFARPLSSRAPLTFRPIFVRRPGEAILLDRRASGPIPCCNGAPGRASVNE